MGYRRHFYGKKIGNPRLVRKFEPVIKTAAYRIIPVPEIKAVPILHPNVIRHIVKRHEVPACIHFVFQSDIPVPYDKGKLPASREKIAVPVFAVILHGLEPPPRSENS